MEDSGIDRRKFLAYGLASGAIGVAAVLANASGAAALPGRGGRMLTYPYTTATIDNLGTAVPGLAVNTGLLVGDNYYVGSRQMSPTKVMRFHLPTSTVTAEKSFADQETIGKLAWDGADYLYVGILVPTATDATIYRWDLSDDSTTPFCTIPALAKVLDMVVASNGTIYAVGEQVGQTAPNLYEIDPSDGSYVAVATPDANAKAARGLAVDDDYVYFGSGSVRGGGGGASTAALYQIDRSSYSVTEITLPVESEDDADVQGLDIIGTRLYVGTKGQVEKGHLFVLDMTDFSVEAIEDDLDTPRVFLGVGSEVYFNANALYKYTPATATTVAVTGGENVRGTYGYWSGSIVSENNIYVAVTAFDLSTSAFTVYGLKDAGATDGALQPISLAALNGHAYVGGNGTISHRDLVGSTIDGLDMDGEAKDMVINGTDMYAAIYNAEGLWTFDAATSTALSHVADFPPEQNRPYATAWDDVNSIVAVGIQSDTTGEGSLCLVDPATAAVTVCEPAVAGAGPVFSAFAEGGLVYVGGGDFKGRIACWDVATATQLWRKTLYPNYNIRQVYGLVKVGTKLFGATNDGVVFSFNLSTLAVVSVATLGSSYARAELVVVDGEIFGGSADTVFHLDQSTLTATNIATGLAGEWFGPPKFTADENGILYSVDGRDLITITLS